MNYADFIAGKSQLGGMHGLPAQGALQTVYAGLSVWGWCKWRARP